MKTMEKFFLLVVDDDLNLRRMLIKRLKLEGYDVHGAETGEEALERLKQIDYQVVIVDLEMPGLDGIELLKQIVEKYPRTQVIIATGFGDAAETMKLGAFDYISKPFRTNELLVRIRRAIECRKTTKAKGESEKVRK